MSGITMYSTDWCPDCRVAKRVFTEQKVEYVEINIEREPSGAEIVRSLNNGNQVVPTINFPDGSILVEPSAAVLKEKLASLAL